MLKFIYKTMLIALLSCSLMALDINTKGMHLNSALAADAANEKTPQFENTGVAGASETHNNFVNNIASNKEANTNSTNTTKETVKTDGIKDSDMMATLTMTSVGILTQRLWTCKMTTDMMIAAGAGAMFIAGEILATFKLKKVMKDLETEITRKDGKLDQKQIETLEKLKKSYEEAKKTANTKKTLQQAAAAAFAAAGVVAYTQIAAEEASETACLASKETTSTACEAKGTALASGVYTAAAAPPFFAGAIAMLGSVALRIKNFLVDLIPKPSATAAAEAAATEAAAAAAETASASTCPINAASVASCKLTNALKKTNQGVCPTLVNNEVPSFIKYAHAPSYINYAEMQSVVSNRHRILEVISNFILAEAKADLLSPMGIASSAAISYVLKTNIALGRTIDSYLFSSKNRAVIWGLLAGLTYAASGATDNQISKLESNIQKIDRILNTMYSLGNGVAATNPKISNPKVEQAQLGQFKIDALNGDEDIDLGGVPGGKMPCFTGEGKTCDSFEEKMEKDQGFMAMNDQSQAMVKDIMKTADGYNNKSRITKGALASSANLAGKSNAINNALKKAKEDFAKNSYNKDRFNIKAKEKELASSIEGSVRAGLKKSGMSSGQMMSAMYGGKYSDASSGSTAVAGTEEVSNKEGNKVAAVPTVDIGSASAVPTDLGINNEEVAESGMSAEDANAAMAAASANQSMDDYELKNDINKNKESSIFELISNRYQKSGYQRLFKRKN